MSSSSAQTASESRVVCVCVCHCYNVSYAHTDYDDNDSNNNDNNNNNIVTLLSAANCDDVPIPVFQFFFALLLRTICDRMFTQAYGSPIIQIDKRHFEGD